jgi:hypothetical protein
VSAHFTELVQGDAFLKREQVFFADSVRLVDNLPTSFLACGGTYSYNSR